MSGALLPSSDRLLPMPSRHSKSDTTVHPHTGIVHSLNYTQTAGVRDDHLLFWDIAL